jgi:hypothetical protein
MSGGKVDAWLSRERVFALLVSLPAAWHLAELAWIVGTRFVFPFDVDWLEGTSLYQAHRLLHGQPLYTAGPDHGFVPTPYPPVYFAVVAGVGWAAGGVSHAVGRAVSIGSLLAALVVAAAQVRARGRAIDARLAAAFALGALALAVCGYPLVAAYFDIVRPDSLMTALLVLGVAAAAVEAPRARHAVASAALLGLAVWTKQTAVFTAAGVTLGWLLRGERRLAALHATVLAAGCGTAFALAQWMTGGSFSVWLFAMRHHDLEWARLGDALARLVLWVPFLVAAFAGLGLRWRRTSGATRVWAAAALFTIPGSLLAYIKVYGFVNNYVPVLVLAGPATALVGLDLVAARDQPSRVRALRVAVAVQAALLLGRVYLGVFFEPPPEARDAARALNRQVAALQGDVLCPIDPFLPIATGHPEAQAPLLSFLDAGHSQAYGVRPGDYARFVRERKPRYLLLAGKEQEREVLDLAQRDYEHVRDLEAPHEGDVLLMISIPNRLYERKEDAP